MSKLLRKIALMTVLTPGALSAWSQTALDVHQDLSHPVVLHDSLHITPAMVDSIASAEDVEEFDQPFASVAFVPKKQWVLGVSVGYTQSTQKDYQFLVLEGLSADTYTVRVSPMFCYMFKNDMGAGARFSYTRALTKLAKGDVVLGEGTEFNVDHLYSLSHNYYGTAIFRNYFSLGNSKRFGFFSEIQCQLGGGQSKLTTGVGSDVSGTYETNFSVDVGVVPGLVMFLSNYSAIEVNVGVLGYSYRHTKSTTDQIYVAHRKVQSANFRINLFSVSFGATFYI